MSEHTNITVILGVEIGGSHISSALINSEDWSLLPGTYCTGKIEANNKPGVIIDQWLQVLSSSLQRASNYELTGIGIAIPGPFDYKSGISKIEGVNKYQSLFGVNIRQIIYDQLSLSNEIPVIFNNDAACFGLGESVAQETLRYKRTVAVTLGTGFGSSFINEQKLVTQDASVPPRGEMYNTAFANGIAEDYISGKWITNRFNEISGKGLIEVKEIAQLALNKDVKAQQVFEEFGYHLFHCLQPWLRSFGADCLVIGGSISKAADLFLPLFRKELSKDNHSLHISTLR